MSLQKHLLQKVQNICAIFFPSSRDCPQALASDNKSAAQTVSGFPAWATHGND